MTEINRDAIPEELKTLQRWLVWRWDVRGGKPTKIPCDARGYDLDANAPASWIDFDAALERARRFDGIGFAVGGSGFTGVDLDHCIEESGEIAEWAWEIVRRLDSYTEVTPSGEGLRVWVRGELPPGRRRKGQIELYDSGRYFTVTGHHLDGLPRAIHDRHAELAALHAELFPAAAPRPKPRPPSQPPTPDDRTILDRMFGSKGGPKIEALFRGETGGYPSGSEADLALCAHLAFWCGGDVDAMDRLFRRSGLCDEKWTTRDDYRRRTIEKALEGARFYDPNYRSNGHGSDNGYAARENDNGNGNGNGNDIPRPPGEPEVNDRGRPEAADDPHRLARVYLDRRCQHRDGLTLRFWAEEWHRWNGQAWRVCLSAEIHAELTATIKAEFDRIADERDGRPKPVTTTLINNVTQALKSITLLSTRDYPRQPAWLDRQPGEDLPDVLEVLTTSNALVHLPSCALGEPCTMPPTPRFFSPTALGYAFDPTPAEPALWIAFLRSLWPEDEESIDCLQEWFGYLLTSDTSQQKMLMLVGPKRSGKGTIGRVLRAVVGPSNVTAPTLSALATPFGAQPLIGKTVALIADARLSGRSDTQVIVERLLSISGEDAQTIDRKHVSSWTGELTTRFVLISNELPRLGDSSGALPSRMILLRLTTSFYGSEDVTLTGRLLTERSAILRWAIAGWHRLRTRGYFAQPESGRELLSDLDELSSPVAAFVEECCEVGPDWSVAVKDLFSAWKNWCLEKGRDHPGDEQGFGRLLRAALPHLRVKRKREGADRTREYEGVGLKSRF